MASVSHGMVLFQQYSCVYDEDSAGAKMSGTVSIKKGSESGLLGAVANVGPVAVAVDGSSNAFRVSYTMSSTI